MIENILTDWKSRRIDGLCVAVILAAGVLFYFVAIRPGDRRQAEAEAAQAQLTGRQAVALRLTKGAVAIKERLADIRKTLADSPIKLEQANRANSRIARLADLAGDSGLNVNEIHPAEPKLEGQFALVPIRLLGNGRYGDWTAFLSRLPEAFPDVAVDSFELAGNPASPATPVDFRVNFVWYATPSTEPDKP